MTAQALEVKEKKELQPKGETTYEFKVYQPDVDILENEKEIVVYADMPGVGKDDIEVTLENHVLSFRGRVRPDAYQGLRPLYIEYNVGNFERQFHLTEEIDQNKIEASVEDGVLTLRMKKAEKALPRRIEIR